MKRQKKYFFIIYKQKLHSVSNYGVFKKKKKTNPPYLFKIKVSFSWSKTFPLLSFLKKLYEMNVFKLGEKFNARDNSKCVNFFSIYEERGLPALKKNLLMQNELHKWI